MERPIALMSTRAAPRAPRLDTLDFASGSRVLLLTVLAVIAGALLGATLTNGPMRQAAALAGASSAGLAMLLAALQAIAPAALRDRSLIGCAWHGERDDRIALAFLAGGAISALDASLGLRPRDAHAPYAEWPLAAGMIYAFAAIALRPVLEELALRGALFAVARNLHGTALSAALAVLPSVALALLFTAGPRASLPATTILAASAMWLRWRHAALGPAIALHSGAAFTCCTVAALG